MFLDFVIITDSPSLAHCKDNEGVGFPSLCNGGFNKQALTTYFSLELTCCMQSIVYHGNMYHGRMFHPT